MWKFCSGKTKRQITEEYDTLVEKHNLTSPTMQNFINEGSNYKHQMTQSVISIMAIAISLLPEGPEQRSILQGGKQRINWY